MSLIRAHVLGDKPHLHQSQGVKLGYWSAGKQTSQSSSNKFKGGQDVSV